MQAQNMLLRAAQRVSVSSASVRGFSSAAASEPVKTVKRGPSMGARFTWFLVGAVGSLGLGYYQLAQDIDACTKSVEQSLAELRRDTLDGQKALRKRVADLEH